MQKKEMLETHFPCAEEVEEYLHLWDSLDDYVNQERALDKLFLELCPENKCVEDILIKCSALNDFYSTNILKVHNVAQHYLKQDVDERLRKGDLLLVEDLASVDINGKVFHFYSFASKYCSHHRPDLFPIYDNYVHRLLCYFRDRDHFHVFKNGDLRVYMRYTDIICKFRAFYRLDSYSVKDIDKYLWQLGKEAFNPYQ